MLIKKKYYEIILYNKQCEEIARTKIDKDDLEKVQKYKWSLGNHGYAMTRLNPQKEKKGFLFLHNLILPPQRGLEIDHENTDKLDNRK